MPRATTTLADPLLPTGGLSRPASPTLLDAPAAAPLARLGSAADRRPVPSSFPRLSESAFATSSLPLLLLAGCTAAALAVWPFSAWPSDAACAAADEEGGAVDTGRALAEAWAEDAIGSAPGWLRSTLLIGVGGQVLGAISDLLPRFPHVFITFGTAFWSQLR